MNQQPAQENFINRVLQSSIWGHVHEAIREAFATIKSNKMRSGLVILGVLIGISSLMARVATVAGLNAFIESSMSGQGTPIGSLTKIDIVAVEGMEEMEKRKSFTIAAAIALESVDLVTRVQCQ